MDPFSHDRLASADAVEVKREETIETGGQRKRAASS
jgi:hypothetical protein